MYLAINRIKTVLPCQQSNIGHRSKAMTYRGGPRGVAVDNLSAAFESVRYAEGDMAIGRAIAGEEFVCLKIRLALLGSHSSNFFCTMASLIPITASQCPKSSAAILLCCLTYTVKP
ncbi:MAG TPA: hypothetical protein EYQ43_05740 [Methyloprofundus sp.]|nr:hypothetical protein [Methyloprofundus sp.]